MALQPPAKNALKFLGFIAIIAIAWVGISKYRNRPREVKSSMEIGSIGLPDAPEASLSGNASKLPFPSSEASANGGTKFNWLQMAWNSQLANHYANGGKVTTKGSLFDKYKLQITITRQDDVEKMKGELINFAQDVKSQGTNIPGVFVSVMGDGAPAFVTAVNKELSKLGPEFMAVDPSLAIGISYGEDKVMGPVEWKRDPKNAIGKAVSCYLRDGDMNILLKWASDNGLKVNPNETTFDANAINLISASDFLDAANKYITGYTEKRKIVANGKTTGKDTTIGVDAVATWTPGDVNIAKKKGGLVNIASTKQYSTQMPNITITVKKWAEAHRDDIDNIILAQAQAGDQVRSFEDAKKYAAGLSAKIWDEQNPDYWLTYYNGKTEKDMQGLSVDLGGSKVFNLADMANTFGLGTDGIDRYKIVYSTFGDILSRMYPELMPNYTKYENFVDKSYLSAVIDAHPELLQGKSLTATTKYSNEITNEISNKSYSIEFETGSATIKPESLSTLKEILNSSIVAENLTLGVYGHTDNTGNPDANQQLSEARAQSVKKWLTNKGLEANRIVTKGYGSSEPLENVDANSASGRAKNRRVQIVLGE
jgi:OOP family OmpA-OmpF porin